MSPDQPCRQNHEAQQVGRTELTGERSGITEGGGQRSAAEYEEEDGHANTESQQQRSSRTAAPACAGAG
ncbi:hypothetical protein ACG83_21625 [Frankia sp. R43]|nr:hypothetical protein ACG83_21625 [Frankia sp. R43]